MCHERVVNIAAANAPCYHVSMAQNLRCSIEPCSGLKYEIEEINPKNVCIEMAKTHHRNSIIKMDAAHSALDSFTPPTYSQDKREIIRTSSCK